LDCLIGISDDKKAVDDLDAGFFCFAHGGFNLCERLIFSDAVEDLLAAAFDAKHESAAVGFGHGREQMLSDRVNASFTAPLNSYVIVIDSFADGLDAFWLQQKMIVHEIHGPVTEFLEILEFIHHVLRRSAPPLPFRSEER